MLSIVKSVYLTSTRHETSVTTNAEERTASSWLCAPPCPRTACGCLNSKKSTWETPFEKLRERQGFFGLSFLKKSARFLFCAFDCVTFFVESVEFDCDRD